MKLTKEEIYGFGSSALLCLLIVLMLAFIFLRTEVRAEAEGIPVEFGAIEWASGADEPAPSGNDAETPVVAPVPEVVPQPAPPVAKPPAITQNVEQTAAIEAEKQRKEQERKLEQEKREAERKRLEEEQRRKDAINRQLSEAFGAGNAPGGSQGTAATGSGNQGSPQGNAAGGVSTGEGGVGSFNLSGRSLRGGGLQRPAYDVQEEGAIVVEITVNPQGDVIQAEIRLLGTNIENAHMRRSAVEAAKKTKFNGIAGAQNQIGTITYRYTLK
ncbi:MAG: TonB family protein [Dysgonamonadaceae bacterium]|jgi:TonB family protein|nr:TonB family protein [Dysgonamonadaceae bacterium]